MSSGGVSAGVVGAAVARRRRKIVEAFRAVRANAPERAVPEASLNIRGNLVFKSMLKRGVVVRLPDGRLYLDEAAEAVASRRRHLILAAVLLLCVIGIAWVVAMHGPKP